MAARLFQAVIANETASRMVHLAGNLDHGEWSDGWKPPAGATQDMPRREPA
jgi:hypothetical protein